jgi:integrase
MSASYIRLIHIIISDSLRIALKNKLIVENPAASVVLPKGRKQQNRRAITPKERHYILKTCETHRAGLFYLIMLYCGLRPGEVAALQWRNVDLKSRVLTVDSAVKPDGSIGQPKSDSGFRRVPIPEALADVLEERSGTPFEFVCTNASGGRLTKSSMKQQWASFRRQLNIEMGCRTYKGALVPPYPVAEDLVPYCLRHTYCTDLQAAGVPINVARELMGHSDISITSKIYTHSSGESFDSAAEMIYALDKRRKGIVENCSASEDISI